MDKNIQIEKTEKTEKGSALSFSKLYRKPSGRPSTSLYKCPTAIVAPHLPSMLPFISFNALSISLLNATYAFAFGSIITCTLDSSEWKQLIHVLQDFNGTFPDTHNIGLSNEFPSRKKNTHTPQVRDWHHLWSTPSCSTLFLQLPSRPLAASVHR